MFKLFSGPHWMDCMASKTQFPMHRVFEVQMLSSHAQLTQSALGLWTATVMTCTSACSHRGFRGYWDSLSHQSIKHMCYCFPVCLSSLTFDKLRSFLSLSPSSSVIVMMLFSTVTPLQLVRSGVSRTQEIKL